MYKPTSVSIYALSHIVLPFQRIVQFRLDCFRKAVQFCIQICAGIVIQLVVNLAVCI